LVLGAIVHHDDLMGREDLCMGALDGLSHEIRIVVVVDEDAESGGVHGE